MYTFVLGLCDPSPLYGLAAHLYYTIHATSPLLLTLFPDPPPPWIHTYFMVAPLPLVSSDAADVIDSTGKNKKVTVLLFSQTLNQSVT